MTHDDVIFAAAVAAIEARAGAYMLHRSEVEALAEEVLVATRHLIEERAEADLRERLAAAIEAEVTHDLDACTTECDSPYCWGCKDCAETLAYRHAARIVRERP